MSSHAQMFDDIDRMDADAWAAHLAPDAVMRFGNADPVHGREACRDALAAFYGQINGLAHHVLEQWEHGEATIVEADVTYTAPMSARSRCRWSRSTGPTPQT